MDTAFTISFGDSAEALEIVLDIMRDSGAVLEIEIIQSGHELYRREIKEGILPEIFESLRRTKLFLKAPTKKPKGDEYLEVMDAICDKLNVHTKIEYFVSDTTPGVGIVEENATSHINTYMIEDINKASVRLGGENYAYSIDELGLVFESAMKNCPQIKTKYYNLDELKESFANFDVIFAAADSAKEIKKAIKPKFGCTIYLGSDYAFFEPMEDYNKNDKALLLAAALMLKYAGQSDAAWALYNKLSTQ